MSMKKIFFFDIDGTIVDSSRNLFEVSDKTKYAFKELMKDNYVLIASGRCKGLLDENITRLNPNGYVLCNGSYAEVNGETVFKKTFSVKEVNEIKRITKQLGGFYIAETLDELFVESVDDPLLGKFLSGWKKSNEGFIENPEVCEGIHIFMVGFKDEETVNKAKELLSSIAGVDRHYWFLSHDINIKGIDKGYGCKKVIEALNVDLKDTYAFGDGINDLQMMQSVGHPVLMKNASPVMKEYDFEMTDDVLEDGVYNYLVKNKLIKPIK